MTDNIEANSNSINTTPLSQYQNYKTPSLYTYQNEILYPAVIQNKVLILHFRITSRVHQFILQT